MYAIFCRIPRPILPRPALFSNLGPEDYPFEVFCPASPMGRFFRYQTTFWLYTFHLIYVNANPMGDGFEFVAVVPFGFVLFALVMPSLFLGSTARRLPFGAALAVAGLPMNQD